MHYKRYIFGFFAIVFSSLGWYFFSKIFTNERLFAGNGLNWILFVVTMALSYSFVFLAALVKDNHFFAGIALLNSATLLVFLGVNARNLLSAGAMFLATFMISDFSNALSRSLSLRYFVTAYSRIAFIILVLIGVSSAYLQIRVSHSITSQGFSEQTSNFAWPYIGKYLSQFDSNVTVDNYLRDQFKAEGIKSPTNSMIEGERKAISQQVGFELSGHEKMSDVGKKFVSNKLAEILRTYNLNKAGVFVIFFTLLVLWPIGRFIFAAVAALVALICRRSGILKVKETQITTKTLEI